MTNPDPERDAQLALPKPLRNALANYSNQQVLVSAERDAEVLKVAKENIRRRHISVRRARWAWSLAAAAVLIGLVIWSAFWTADKRRPIPAAMGQKTGDIDGNGTVDIFDAFALARHVNPKTAGVTWDINGDGLVDGRDVSLIAQRAVQLPRGPMR
jgi:hypothetical protein